MRELSIEMTEQTKGGFSFDEMLFYATASLYHMGQLSTSDTYWPYHAAGMNYYNARLVACM